MGVNFTTSPHGVYVIIVKIQLSLWVVQVNGNGSEIVFLKP